MGIVSFRLPDDVEKRLRARGINPGARAKELLEGDIRKRSVEEDMAFLRRHAIRAKKTAAQLVREIREEH